jgi:hypothetical protein
MKQDADVSANQTDMMTRRAITVSLLLLFASEAFAELFLVKGDILKFSAAVPLLILVAIGSATAILGRNQPATPILCLLLSSMAAILSKQLSIFEEEVVGRIAAIFFRFEWSALFWIFGFCFIHFALIFPVESRLIRKTPRFIWLIYSAYAILLFGTYTLPFSIQGFLQLLSMFAGLFLGLLTLIRKFFTALTSAEKNRLRIVLIGCLAGAFPAALWAILAIFDIQDVVLDSGLFMLPLFFVGLVAAVLYENFFEISIWLQRTLIYSLAASGSIACFFFCYFLMLLSREILGRFPVNHPLAISVAPALITFFPLVYWSSSYISTRFIAVEESEPAHGDAEPAFRPIEPNPYIAGNPIRSPEIFFGREEDFRFIRMKLLAEQQGCVIVLRGERRTGKTSILYQILNGRLGADFIPVFIDMQGIVVQTDEEFLSELAEKIREAALSLAPANVSRLPAIIDSFPSFSHFISAIMDAIGNRRLVLLVDEYELIETKVKSGRLSTEIFGYLDSLLICHPRLSYVFTGSRGLDSTGAWTPILARSVYREISFLARKDAEALVCTPLQHRIRFTPAAVSNLLRLTNGHPFFTQAMCQTLVEALNDLKKNLVDGKCIEETLRRLLENAPPQLYYLWTTFSDSEKMVLSALATLLKGSHQYLAAERVEKLLRSLPGKFPKQLTIPVIRMHFEQLREKSTLDRDQTRYRFTLDLMRLWVQSEHNAWKVLSETGNERTHSGAAHE